MKARGTLLIAIFLFLSPAAAEEKKKEPLKVPDPPTFMSPRGRGSVSLPEPTREGTFDGTWMHVGRDQRMALWFRTDDDGTLRARFQYQSLANPEAFETDWNGEANYYLSGHTAEFHLDFTSRDPDYIEGEWRWDVDFVDSGRHELGKFAIYRGHDGRQLVFTFTELERLVRRLNDVQRTTGRPVWTFVKASKRTVLWDEIF